jgi:MFS family permease
MNDRSAAQAWYCVALLCALSALSFVDRYILSLVAHDVSLELGLSDSQMGLLLGVGFAAVYSLIGFPLAHLIDRSHRVRIVVAGVTVWSLSTTGSAFVHDFATLALCRSGIAAGEAVLGPAAISLIGDLFTRERRTVPVATYGTIAAVMGTGALAIGGGALRLAHLFAPNLAMAPWRITMLIIGLPGVALALVLLLTVREPARQDQARDARPADPSWQAFLHELKASAGVYAPFYAACCAIASAVYGLTSWAPTLLIRLYGLEASQVGFLLGTIGVPAALAGSVCWPWLARRLQDRGSSRGIIVAMLISTVLTAPALVLSPLGQSALLIACGVALVKLLNSSGTLAPLALVTIGPGNMRGRLMAIYAACSNLVGLSVGGIAVPLLAKLWPGERMAMAYASALLGAICALVMMISMALCLRALTRRSHAAAAA